MECVRRARPVPAKIRPVQVEMRPVQAVMASTRLMGCMVDTAGFQDKVNQGPVTSDQEPCFESRGCRNLMVTGTMLRMARCYASCKDLFEF